MKTNDVKDSFNLNDIVASLPSISDDESDLESDEDSSETDSSGDEQGT